MSNWIRLLSERFSMSGLVLKKEISNFRLLIECDLLLFIKYLGRRSAKCKQLSFAYQCWVHGKILPRDWLNAWRSSLSMRTSDHSDNDGCKTDANNTWSTISNVQESFMTLDIYTKFCDCICKRAKFKLNWSNINSRCQWRT